MCLVPLLAVAAGEIGSDNLSLDLRPEAALARGSASVKVVDAGRPSGGLVGLLACLYITLNMQGQGELPQASRAM